MIGKAKLTESEKEILRNMVLHFCQGCERHEQEVGKLQPHRLLRANRGGKYCPNNIKMLCEKCHKLYHSNEFSNCKSK